MSSPACTPHHSPDEAAPPVPLPEGTRCPDCSYDLRQLTSQRCPECGFDLDRIRSAESWLPWVRRDAPGWFAAYLKTAWLVLRRTRRFQLELGRPVDWRAAQSFRWTTVSLAFAPLLLVVLGWRAILQRRWELDAHDWVATAGVLGGLLLLLALAPGLASYAVESHRVSRALRNRALALSYYAWAPLSLSFVPAFIYLVGSWPGMPEGLRVLLRPAALGAFAYLFILSWATVGHIAGFVVSGRRALLGRMLGMAAGTMLLALLLLVAFPLSLLFLWEVLQSPR